MLRVVTATPVKLDEQAEHCRHITDQHLKDVFDALNKLMEKIKAECDASRKKNNSRFYFCRDKLFSQRHLEIRDKLYADLQEAYDSDRGNYLVLGQMIELLESAVNASANLQVDAKIRKNPAVTDSQGSRIKCLGYTDGMTQEVLFNKLTGGGAGVDTHLTIFTGLDDIKRSHEYQTHCLPEIEKAKKVAQAASPSAAGK